MFEPKAIASHLDSTQSGHWAADFFQQRSKSPRAGLRGPFSADNGSSDCDVIVCCGGAKPTDRQPCRHGALR